MTRIRAQRILDGASSVAIAHSGKGVEKVMQAAGVSDKEIQDFQVAQFMAQSSSSGKMGRTADPLGH